MNESDLTPNEKAIVQLLRSQPGNGLGLLSYAWLKMCVFHRGPAAIPNYPDSERVLTRCLGRLVKWRLLKHIVAPDHGAWYCLPEVWEAMTQQARQEVRAHSMHARGSKEAFGLLLPGPAGTTSPIRERLWAEVRIGDTVKYRGVAFLGVRDPEEGIVHPAGVPVVDPGIRLVSFKFTTGIPGRPMEYENVTDAE